ncbi:MAG: hypothetical protein H0W84_10855 [Bacteroidetes bacterium]|nr:hypothetical protein [Bacteroidota bacterium]
MHSQTEAKKVKQLPSVAIGAGVLSFNGDLVGDGMKIFSFARIKTGYNITVEQRIGKYLGASLNCIYGKLADKEQSKTRNQNFQSTIIQTDLYINIHFDNDLIEKQNISFKPSPYLFIGFGYLQFDPYEDLMDKNGETYNYWNDGSIRSIPEGDINAAYATVLHRDYSYETKRVDSAKHSTFTVPVGAAINLKILDNFSINIGAAYYFTFTDYIDNVKSGKNDNYLFANVSLQYSFTKREKEMVNNKRYENVDFLSLDNSDSDQDGVLDNNDQCQGTPKGVKVNLVGCPMDNDEDGIPDYRDKELTTIKGAMVNTEGVTQTAKMIKENQKKKEALPATERSDVFNQNPSLAYLKDFDFEALSGKKTRATIPTDLKAADINNDGYITGAEMRATIEAFFEGTPNFTVERLNDLVDFYFEQIK